MRYQSYIHGKNHWLLDPDLKPILERYWPAWTEKEKALSAFGDLVGSKAYEIADYVDGQGRPRLVMHDLDGVRVDRVRLCPAHEDLLIELVSMNRPPYEGGTWHHHFSLGYLLADPGLYCTMTVTNQTAYAIFKYAPDQKHWLEPLLSGKAWGATWMTETQGGSDLGANTTSAFQEAGKWRLEGEDKYFASNAGIADIALVTARPEGARPGPKGLALFLVPRVAEDGSLNYRVRRLKEKSATRAVPTGEVELLGSEAALVGDAEKGIYYTLETLTVSRLANAVGAMGLARKAHLEALFRTQARSAFQKKLIEHPLVRRDLTDMAVRTAAGLVLLFHGIDAFQNAWRDRPPYSDRYHYARFLSHLVKNRTADHAAAVTLLAMELFGGLGFLDEYAVARLHREALITPIWEGTSNIQALDMLEAMGKKGAHEPFMDEFLSELKGISEPEAEIALKQIEGSLSQLSQLPAENAQWISKDVLNTLADAAQVALLFRLAENGGDRYTKLAKLFAARFLLHHPYPDWALADDQIWQPIAG